MTGRARGRSRGRGRANQNAPPPGAAPPVQAAAQPQQIGRGRSRGQNTERPQSGPPPSRTQTQAQAQAAPVREMAAMNVQKSQDRGRRRTFDAQPCERNYRDPNDSKQGVEGKKVNVVANFFKVTKLPKFDGLFQYVVTFNPDVQSSRLKSYLVHAIEDIIGTTQCFDGMTLFLPKRLPERETIKNVTLQKGDVVQVKVTFTNEVPQNSPSVVQLMNVLFRRQLRSLKMQLVGRHHYDPTKKIDVQAHSLQVWPGFETSILQHENDVLLCANVVHKVLNSKTVLEVMYELYQQTQDKARFPELCKKKLVGQIILTRYNNKTYRVDDIDWNKHPTDTFDDHGKNTTFSEYMKTKYGKEPQDTKQPLLLSQPKDKDRKRGMTTPILLVPEFCSITGLSDDLRSNFTVMKDLAQHTRMGPPGKVQELQKFMAALKSNPAAAKELNDWNLEFSSNLLELNGRTLPPQPMGQKNCKFSYQEKDADWQRETRGKELVSAINMNNWLLLFTHADERIAGDFLQTLKRVAGPMGMRVNDPQRVKLPGDNGRVYSEALRANIRENTEIVVCIVPNNRKDRYDIIKKLTCVDCPVPSQVIVRRTLSKQQMLMSVCTKIAIQLNCKLGGEVWTTEIPVKKLMVVGFDVYHDTLNRGQSIGGFIASTNHTLTRYFSRITRHRSKAEISEQLKVCMTGALKKYHEINGFNPERIVVYRDGVGDGQLGDLEATEIRQMKEAIHEYSNGQITKFAMIVVKKRVSTRLFAKTSSGFSNPMPGTVVDSDVTRPQYYDFFLVSQSVRQGTVTPVHYNIITNTVGFKPDHFQKLTYKLCHLYYNWPGTIKVPAPCQYAHKLAFLIGQSVHTEPDSQLSDRLFYL